MSRDPASTTLLDRCGGAGLGLVVGLVTGLVVWLAVSFASARDTSAPLTILGSALCGGLAGFALPFGTIAVAEHVLHFIAGVAAVFSAPSRGIVDDALRPHDEASEPLRRRSLDAALVLGAIIGLALSLAFWGAWRW